MKHWQVQRCSTHYKSGMKLLIAFAAQTCLLKTQTGVGSALGQVSITFAMMPQFAVNDNKTCNSLVLTMLWFHSHRRGFELATMSGEAFVPCSHDDVCGEALATSSLRRRMAA